LAALSNGTPVHLFLSLESARLGTPTGADGMGRDVLSGAVVAQ
jgi:hypothetical protein